MKLSIKSMAIIVVGAFALGIAGANLLGFWQTTSSKQPVVIKEGEFAGLPNPADIRGSYTWADVAKAFGFDAKRILKAFGASDETEKVNTLEAIYGAAGLPAGVEIGTDSVRLFVSLLTGLPYAAEDTTVLPVSAIAVLRESGKADAALIDAVAAKAYDPANTAASVAPPVSAPASPVSTLAPKPSAVPAQPASTTVTTVKTEAAADHVATAGTLTGKTTFKELKDWGLSETDIKSVTGGKIGPDSSIVKDWMAANGLTFSELKVKLQELLDAKK
ncbi:MAG: hypothetical protein WC820_11600 [Spirochaetales bacterium]|jgi:hypothetical protein